MTQQKARTAKDILEDYFRYSLKIIPDKDIPDCERQLCEAILEIVGPDLPTYAHDSKRWNDYLAALRQKLRVFFNQPEITDSPPLTLKSNFPELIKRKRLEFGETQSDFGKRFGVSHAAVSDWESGKSEAPYAVTEWLLNLYQPSDTKEGEK